MNRRRSLRPYGQIRQSQVVTTFGPGALLDLPNHSVIVGGLDYWSPGGEEISEPRLVAKLQALLQAPALKLYAPPPDNQDPVTPPTGIRAWQFPEWFITQDVEDFLRSPYGRPTITNSSLQLLLKQAPATIEIVGKAFGLTEAEKNLLLGADVGTGLFFAGKRHVAIQIVSSYFEDRVITTNPEQLLEEEKGLV